MGWLTNLLNKGWQWLFGGDAQNPVTSLVNSFTGAGLTGAEAAANQFNADQAALAYERQQEFYDKNQSIVAQVAQAKAAGVNPAALYGNLSGSGASSVPQAAGSVSPGNPMALGGIDTLLSLAQGLFSMREEKRVNDSVIDEKQSNAERNRADAANKEADTLLKSIDAKTREEFNRLRNESLIEGINVAKQQVEESSSRTALYEAETALKKIDEKSRGQLNHLQVNYMTALAAMETERAKQYGQELAARLASIIAETELKNASAAQIREYCKIMLENGVDTDGDGVPDMSRLSQMSDAEIEGLQKSNSMAWTKVVSTIAGGLGGLAAVGLAIGKLTLKAVIPPVVPQFHDGTFSGGVGSYSSNLSS